MIKPCSVNCYFIICGAIKIIVCYKFISRNVISGVLGLPFDRGVVCFYSPQTGGDEHLPSPWYAPEVLNLISYQCFYHNLKIILLGIQLDSQQ